MNVILALAIQLTNIAIVAAIVILSMHDKPGWGWLMVLLAIGAGGVTFKRGKP